MKILLKNLCIVDPNSPHNGKTRDILIESGKIRSIEAKSSNTTAKEIDFKGKLISPGWFDINVHFCDPGFEVKEDIQSGCKAAAAGGFTSVALLPDTLPPLHSKGEIEYVINKSKGNLVNVYPLGTISKDREGKDISEMYDMYLSGARAFTDGSNPVQDAGLLNRALLYAKNFNGLIITYCEDASIAGNGKMNEGTISTELGIKGIPAMAEEMMIARNIQLAEYTDAPIHISHASTEKSVELIRAAKKKGLKITADVAAYSLVLDDSYLLEFDSNYKVKPPLRTKQDIKALIQGLKDGTIDAICSAHRPQDIEHKDVEFEIAAYGMIGLQTSFSLITEALSKSLSKEQIIEKISINPRKILNLEIATIKEDQAADFTIYDPETQWILDADNILSKSKNTPFIGRKLTGRAIAVMNNNQFHKCFHEEKVLKK